MSVKLFILAHEEARIGAADYCLTKAPDGWVVRFSPPSKSRDQESHYHALIGDFAEQGKHCATTFDEESWKRILVDAFHWETKNDPDLAEDWRHMGEMQFAPAMGHPGVVMFGYQTRRFTRKLASHFIDWLYALGDQMDPPIRWSNPALRKPDEQAP